MKASVDFTFVKITNGGTSLNKNTTLSQIVLFVLQTFIVVSLIICVLILSYSHLVFSQILYSILWYGSLVLMVSTGGLSSMLVILGFSSSLITLMITVDVS